MWHLLFLLFAKNDTPNKATGLVKKGGYAMVLFAKLRGGQAILQSSRTTSKPLALQYCKKTSPGPRPLSSGGP